MAHKGFHNGRRVGSVFAAVHEAAFGTERTCRSYCGMSVDGGKAENIYSWRVFRILTHKRHAVSGDGICSGKVRLPYWPISIRFHGVVPFEVSAQAARSKTAA